MTCANFFDCCHIAIEILKSLLPTKFVMCNTCKAGFWEIQLSMWRWLGGCCWQIFIYICILLWVYINMYIWIMYIYIYMNVYIHIYIHIYKYMYTYIYARACPYVSVHVCVCVCVWQPGAYYSQKRGVPMHSVMMQVKTFRKSARCKFFVYTVIVKLNFENCCMNLEYLSPGYFSAENSGGAVRTGKTKEFRKYQLAAEFTSIQLVYSYVLRFFFFVWKGHWICSGKPHCAAYLILYS